MMRHRFTILIAPIIRIFFVTCFRNGGYRHLRVEGCHFWGPPEFIDNSKIAITELFEIDPELHQKIMRCNKLLFWYTKLEIVDDRFCKMYTISGPYSSWGTRGILSRLVYGYFLTRELGNRPLAQLEAIPKHNAIRSMTVEWLLRHSFPKELVEPFTVPAS